MITLHNEVFFSFFIIKRLIHAYELLSAVSIENSACSLPRIKGRVDPQDKMYDLLHTYHIISMLEIYCLINCNEPSFLITICLVIKDELQ